MKKEVAKILVDTFEKNPPPNTTTGNKSASVTGYGPLLERQMLLHFERFVSSKLNWPIERTGASYHDERTAGAWEVFKFAHGS